MSHQQLGHMEMVPQFKGRFLLFQEYRSFAHLFLKLSVSIFYKAISKFQQKYRVKRIRIAVLRGIP